MRIPLLGGAYTARGIPAACQSEINIFPEINPEESQSPVKITHYLTPGLDLLLGGVSSGAVRCTYRTSKGKLYVVISQTIYYINSSYEAQVIGAIGTSTTPVSMIDNGLVIVVVDGSSNGYAIRMDNNAFGQISATNFYGATRVEYLDTYFIFNRPSTNQFYISLSLVTYAMLIAGTAFDALDIASKSGFPDNIVTIIVIQGYLWLIGELTTEIWYDSGATDFPFQRQAGVNVIEHGIVAPYSVAAQDLFPYWITQDLQGQSIIVKGDNYQLKRISTHAIEYELSTYSTIADCITYIYQQQGHIFVVFNFPTANKTWVYDVSSELWHQRAYTDDNGVLNRHRGNCSTNAYGKTIVGDWQNGNIYAFNTNTYTDNGQPITRIRTFPHLVQDGNRISYSQFQADMAVGNSTVALDQLEQLDPPTVFLRWSDNRGVSYGNRVGQTIGRNGEYFTSIQWQRLGYARDRVFELSWSSPVNTSLQGCWLRLEAAET